MYIIHLFKMQIEIFCAGLDIKGFILLVQGKIPLTISLPFNKCACPNRKSYIHCQYLCFSCLSQDKSSKHSTCLCTIFTCPRQLDGPKCQVLVWTIIYHYNIDKTSDHKKWCTILLPVRAGVCRPCVLTELTATEKSATDGNWSVTTLCRHKCAYDRIRLVADRKYPIADIHPCSRTAT